MSPVEGSKPDENLVTSFVAMAGGLEERLASDQSGSETNTVRTTSRQVTNTSTTTSSAGPEGNTTTVRATVERTPINEFSDLARILSNAFPMEFPFGVDREDLGSSSSILKRVLKRLTRVYDGRVAHNYVLLMYLANVQYRHASLASTTARVDADSAGEVVDIVNHPDWKARAEAVAKNPTGPEAQALVKQIAPLVKLAGKKVPWSPLERLSASYHIYAMYHVFGAPAFFVTFSPKILTNQLMLRFGEMQRSEDDTIDLDLPEHLQHRVKLLTSNTIAQARAYELMLDAVLSVLFGIQPESRSHKTHMPKPGLFGTPTAYYGVTECQARNALHAHFVVWVRTMHPEMIQRIAHDEDLRQVLINAIDSVVTASTENFEKCVSESKVVCKFDSKPYGIRYGPTDTCKSVKLHSVVWGSRASKFDLSPGMTISTFDGKNVTDMRSESVRDMIKKHTGPVTIVFHRTTIFDPATGRVKKPSEPQPETTPFPNVDRKLSVKFSAELNRYVSEGSIAKTFVPPWKMDDTPPKPSDGGGDVTGTSPVDKDDHDSTDDSNLHITGASLVDDDGGRESTVELNVNGGGEKNEADPTDYHMSLPLRDNILDQDFDVTRLSEGDVFFDGNNGDACNVDDYTLGWVEVVAVHGRSVFLSPIYSPERPFVPKGVHDIPNGSREDMIDDQYVDTKLRPRRLPDSVIEVIRERNCWEWDASLANKAAALHRLKVRGQIVMSAYNVHGFPNGETQRKHSHRCHKYKGAYKAKWCTLGFGRTVFDTTDLRQVVSEESTGSKVTSDRDPVVKQTSDMEKFHPTFEDTVGSRDPVVEVDHIDEDDSISGSSGDDDTVEDDSISGSSWDDDTKDDVTVVKDCLDKRDSPAEHTTGVETTDPVVDRLGEHDSSCCSDDDTVVNSGSSKQSAFDKLKVRHLKGPDPPPKNGVRDDRVLYLDLKRKCGMQPTSMRKDVENSVQDTLSDRLCSQVVLLTRVHHRVMSFLCHPEDDHHTYSDQYMCETAPVLAALLGCNTNVSPLGGNVQAINALFYLTGYLSKNPVKPTSWITCIIAALKSSFRWESVAEDVGTPSRNAKFFLQKVLNRLNALAEITDTQAAMLLLGFKSFQCSHRFGFCFHRQALEAQVQLYNVNKRTGKKSRVCISHDTSDDHSEPDEDDTSSSDDDSESEVTSLSGTSDSDHPDSESTSSDDDTEPDGNKNTCLPHRGNIIYRNKDNVAFALSQHHHYLHRVHRWKSTLPKCDRGSHTNDLAWWYYHARDSNSPVWRRYQREKGLHDFTLTEYVRHIEVVEMPEKLPTIGPVMYYLFSRDYPICDSHVQKLRSKHLVTVLSGRPPRHPGLAPRSRTRKSGTSGNKRLLSWQLKADLYGRTMGSIFSPWDERGDCGVHSYEDFQGMQQDWEDDQKTLQNDLSWRRFITRDRTLDSGDDRTYPDPDLFPDPRTVARRQHSHNLGVNLRVPKIMKLIANKWRYQNCDRFDNPREYDFMNNEEVEMSDQDKENALAIASLLETFSDKKRGGDVTGIGADTAHHLNRMGKQVERLYGHDTRVRGNIGKKTCQVRGLDPHWYRKPLARNTTWAKKTFKKLMSCKPDTTPVTKDSLITTGIGVGGVTDDSLREGMSIDKIKAFDRAISCFDSNKCLRIFVHGGPGTGKTFLAERIMKAASLRGMTSRFTALSGAAATINGGTTLHYSVGMTRHTKWGSDPTANQIKQIRERNGKMRLLIVDEISMTHAQMWNQVQRHLQHSKLWDTLHIVAMGDFCQLPPPSQFEKALYEDFVLAARKPTAYSSKPLVLAGINSFQTLTKIELTIQNRAKGDPGHMRTIRQLREDVINDEFINNLRPLTAKDVSRDWQFVPMLVTSNAEAILLNKRQIVAFAKVNNQFILKWTNPIKNCDEAQAYDINVVEGIIPEAVQYFCMGAPVLVNANKNPVGTGIVNGYRALLHSLIWNGDPWRPPHKGWEPGQVFEVPRPAYMVVIKDPDTKKNTQKRTNKNGDGSKEVVVDGDSDSDDGSDIGHDGLIPLKTDYHKTWTQGVQINYNAFPLDLRFAITYHKVQGQTMDKVILFLHERKTKQLAPLQWESLYVAYTRVTCGDDIRVCYFGSDNSTDRSGLKHLRKLKRPTLYDVWQQSYDENGRWNDQELRKQAKREQDKLRHKLRHVTSITQVSLKKLKLWANILDVNVPYKPGTKRKNKPQYVEAITPIWAGINGGVLSSVSDKTQSQHVRQKKSKSIAAPPKVNSKKGSGYKNSHKGGLAAEPHDESYPHEQRVPAITPVLTRRQKLKGDRLVRELKGFRNQFRGRSRAKANMREVVYCDNLEYVDQISQWSAFALATPGEFICDTIIYYCGSHFCKGDATSKAFVVDPVIPLGTRQCLTLGIRHKFLERLHDKGQTLVFPINMPQNVHWMVVLVWLNTSGNVVIQCRNSMRSYSDHEKYCCRLVRTYMTRLYKNKENVTYECPVFTDSTPVKWTQQTPNVFACGLHVLSHTYLVSKGLEHTHKFDNEFVEKIRMYCLQLLYDHRTGRQTTYMRPIDLTSDGLRFHFL